MKWDFTTISGTRPAEAAIHDTFRPYHPFSYLRSNTSNSYYYSYVQIAILAVARGTIPIVTSNSLNGTTQIHPPNVIFLEVGLVSVSALSRDSSRDRVRRDEIPGYLEIFNEEG